MDFWALDREVFRAIHVGLRTNWLDPFMAFLSLSGVGIVHAGALFCVALRARAEFFWTALAVVAVGVYGVGAKTGDQFIELAVFALLLGILWNLPVRTAWEAIAAFLLSGGFHLITKAMIPRERPSNFIWASPMEHVFKTHSFPSGHATTAIAIGAILLWSLDDWRLGWAAMIWGVLVGFSRVYVGVHWPSDVVAAAGLGYSSAALVKLVSHAKSSRIAIPK